MLTWNRSSWQQHPGTITIFRTADYSASEPLPTNHSRSAGTVALKVLVTDVRLVFGGCAWCLHKTKEPKRVSKDLIFFQIVGIWVCRGCLLLEEKRHTHAEGAFLYVVSASPCAFLPRLPILDKRVNRNSCHLILDGMQNNGHRLKMYNFVLHWRRGIDL